MSKCHCGSGLEYNVCCEPYISGEKKAPTPEALMRARYCAFVVHDVKFIMKTIIPAKRKETSEESIREWSENSEWYGLEIKRATGDKENDKSGIVEFIAKYKAESMLKKHHEIAEFRKERGIWYFVDGELQPQEPFQRETPKVKRNDPCPCGSGKKYKKCCGK